ncbi:MAG: magnesium transporter [Bacteroidetes bacterium]|nr:magnesium transporter [Bacteroidota bacterium]
MLNQLLMPEIEELIRANDFDELREALVLFEPAEIAALIEQLAEVEAALVFEALPPDRAADVFEHLPHGDQAALAEEMADESDRLAALLNELSPDDRTAFLGDLEPAVVQELLGLLDPDEREVAERLLGYAEDSVGRLVTTDFVAVRPEWTVEQAFRQIRRYGRDSETINIIYVVDADGKLIDDIRIRDLILAEPETEVQSLMDYRYISLNETDDREEAVRMFRIYDRVALPVVDGNGLLIGIITHDDVLDVAEEEATEDIHKLGGSEALDDPYLDTPLPTLIKKRARWLVVLFLGEMLTATAMGYFETEIARAVVLAMFVPLIISSGGNSGSQAASLIIRALAIGEFGLRDWWRVMRRELLSGASLGVILGSVGFLRVLIWANAFGMYGPHWFLIALTVALSLVGVVMWGTLTGSMLPLVLKRLGADPAVSSAPFVATLVDVTGLIIYFSVAALLLTGTLL